MAIYVPQEVNQYKESQVIINSNRLVFNAKKDSILLYSNQAIGFSAGGSIFFDTNQVFPPDGQSAISDEQEDYGRFVVNSPHIYLGLDEDINLTYPPVGNTSQYKLPIQRAVLGDELRSFLRDTLDLFEELLDDLYDNYTVSSAEPGNDSAPSESNEIWMEQFREKIQGLKDDLAINVDNGYTLDEADDCVFLSKRVKIGV